MRSGWLCRPPDRSGEGRCDLPGRATARSAMVTSSVSPEYRWLITEAVSGTWAIRTAAMVSVSVDLVHLDQDGVTATPQSMPRARPALVTNRSSHQLHRAAGRTGQRRPAVPVVFGHPSSMERMGYCGRAARRSPPGPQRRTTCPRPSACNPALRVEELAVRHVRASATSFPRCSRRRRWPGGTKRLVGWEIGVP